MQSRGHCEKAELEYDHDQSCFGVWLHSHSWFLSQLILFQFNAPLMWLQLSGVVTKLAN